MTMNKYHFWWSDQQACQQACTIQNMPFGSYVSLLYGLQPFIKHNMCLIDGETAPRFYSCCSSHGKQHGCGWPDLIYLGEGIVTEINGTPQGGYVQKYELTGKAAEDEKNDEFSKFMRSCGAEDKDMSRKEKQD